MSFVKCSNRIYQLQRFIASTLLTKLLFYQLANLFEPSFRFGIENLNSIQKPRLEFLVL
jgi:hypothetical protein